MGAGTGDFTPIPSPDTSEKKFHALVDEAERFESGVAPKARNVFISFNADDEWAVNLLRSQAKDKRFDVYFRDYSIKEPFDAAWKSQVKDIIDKTSTMVVMIGSETASRDAVNWEIREAHKQGKRVIGMRIHKDKSHPIPEEMKKHGDEVIDWNLATLKDQLQ